MPNQQRRLCTSLASQCYVTIVLGPTYVCHLNNNACSKHIMSYGW